MELDQGRVQFLGLGVGRAESSFSANHSGLPDGLTSILQSCFGR